MIRIYKKIKTTTGYEDRLHMWTDEQWHTWDVACSSGKLRITTDSRIAADVHDNTLNLRTTDMYDGIAAQYARFVETKQKHMLDGGAVPDLYEFTKGANTLYKNNGYLCTINKHKPTADGGFFLLGSRSVGIAKTSETTLTIGVLKQHSTDNSKRIVIQDAMACVWVLYHALNELLYKIQAVNQNKRIYGLLPSYYAACMRWNMYIYNKSFRSSVLNTETVLTISWGHTCNQCTESAKTLHVVFSTAVNMNYENATGIAQFDTAALNCAMSGEYVVYVSPTSSNGTLNCSWNIKKNLRSKKGETSTVTASGYGDDKIFEAPKGSKYYEAYNNWEKIEIDVHVPELRQGDRVALLIQLVRGGRSMTGRVLSTEKDDAGLQTFDVDVEMYDPYLDANTPIKKETVTLRGYVTPQTPTEDSDA